MFVLSFSSDQHERQVGVLAKELGFMHISLSSEVMPMVRIVPRGYTGNFKWIYNY